MSDVDLDAVARLRQLASGAFFFFSFFFVFGFQEFL